MQTVYLKDGTQCRLVSKQDNGYLVEPFMMYATEDGDYDSDLSGILKIVTEVFHKAPIELIEAECQKVYDRIGILTQERDKLQQEKNELSIEVNKLNRQKTDLTKLTFNRSDIKNAKRIVAFPRGNIAPFILDPKNRHKLTLSIEISDYDPKIRAWTYRLYGDDNWSSGDYFDEQFGIKCDISDEEISAIVSNRLATIKFDDYAVKRTDDKWLNHEYIERKNNILVKEKENTRITKEKELKAIQEWLASN